MSHTTRFGTTDGPDKSTYAPKFVRRNVLHRGSGRAGQQKAEVSVLLVRAPLYIPDDGFVAWATCLTATCEAACWPLARLIEHQTHSPSVARAATKAGRVPVIERSGFSDSAGRAVALRLRTNLLGRRQVNVRRGNPKEMTAERIASQRRATRPPSAQHLWWPNPYLQRVSRTKRG